MKRSGLVLLLAALTISFSGSLAQSQAQDRTPASQVVWQHVGRIYLNPNTGQAIYAGYLVHINGISTSLFKGTASEKTAYFTFSTDVLQLTPLPDNGDIVLDLVSAGTFSVYYNTSPGGAWSKPDSFSSGRLIATFQRQESLFPIIGPLGLHSLSERLLSSVNFTFGGQTFNFNKIAPHGITFAQFFSSTPLETGIEDFSVAFPGAGAVVAIGSKISTVGPSAK